MLDAWSIDFCGQLLFMSSSIWQNWTRCYAILHCCKFNEISFMQDFMLWFIVTIVVNFTDFFSAQHEIVVLSCIVQFHSIISIVDDCISVNLSHCGYLKTGSVQRLRFLLHFHGIKNHSNC